MTRTLQYCELPNKRYIFQKEHVTLIVEHQSFGDIMLYLFLPYATAAIPFTEQMLFENSNYVVEAEVISSECLSHSENAEGYQDIRYLATLSIIATQKGDIESSTIELYSHDYIAPPHIIPESCSWYDTAHPVGEIGIYYIQNNGSVNTLHMYGFIPAPESNPSEIPTCTPLDLEPSSEPSIEEPSGEPSGEPSYESNEDIIEEEKSDDPIQEDLEPSDFDTGLSNNTSLTETEGGGCNHNNSTPLSFALISLLMILIRRK